MATPIRHKNWIVAIGRFRSHLIVATAFTVLAGIETVMNSQHAAAQGGPHVTIDGPLSLPVTGATSVSGSVAATQSGAWNVGIIGTPPVILQTPATPIPVSVATPGKSLVHVSQTQNLLGFAYCGGGTLYHNASSKTLVIELVSLFAQQDAGANGNAVVELTTTAGGVTTTHFPVQTSVLAGLFGLGANAMAPHLYADPDTNVDYEIRRADNTGHAAYGITMSGYLADVP